MRHWFERQWRRSWPRLRRFRFPSDGPPPSLQEKRGTMPETAFLITAFATLFDGNDTARLQAARAQWKAMTGAGHAAQYWSEETGHWEKKAESPAKSADPKS